MDWDVLELVFLIRRFLVVNPDLTSGLLRLQWREQLIDLVRVALGHRRGVARSVRRLTIGAAAPAAAAILIERFVAGIVAGVAVSIAVHLTDVLLLQLLHVA